jgi:hypothetical protein
MRHIETLTSPLAANHSKSQPLEKTPLAIAKEERDTMSAVPVALVTLIAFLFSWIAGCCRKK